MVNRSKRPPTRLSDGRYEKLYSMLLDAIPSSVLLIDRDMRIVSANWNFLEKSRRSASNTIGLRLKDVFPPIILDQMNINHRIREVFEKNNPTHGERMTYRVPRLPMRTYYYRVLPVSWGDTVERAMLLMDDITEQVRLAEEVRRVERHLSSVVESASDIVLSTDTAGNILTWNTAAEKISDLSLDLVRDRPFWEFCSKDSQEEVRRCLKSLTMGRERFTAEWDLLSQHGGPIPVSWVLSPIKDAQLKPVGIVAVGRDLTESRKFEMQLLQSQKLAALGVMAGGIAHEIRNPLAISSSAAQFLMEEDIEADFRKECAQKIHNGIHRASAVIENLLRFARAPVKSDFERVNLSALLEETLELVANQAKIEKIAIRALFPKDPLFVSGVASLLQQVFMNLLLNGIQAMPDGGKLGVSLRSDNGEVLVHIKDSGAGIPHGDMDKIFDPFYTTSPVGQGTGLGLSLCYSILKQHFGSIEVHSVKGRGTGFTVRLAQISR